MAQQVSPENFIHISYTEPGWKADPQKLLDAARRWRSPDSMMLPRFDVDTFQRTHGLTSTVENAIEEATPQQVLTRMTAPEFLNGPIEHPWAEDGTILSKIRDAMEHGRPLELVLPSFAGRPHNPAAHRRVAPDLGELYALQLLKNISDAVTRLHAPGLVITLLLDGRAHRDFYGYSDHEGMPYASNLWRQIDLLGARGQIQIVELHDLMSARASELSDIDERVRSSISEKWTDKSFPQRAHLIRALRQGTETTAISSALIEMYKSGDSFPISVQDFADQAELIVQERAEHTAFEYAVLMTKLRELDVIGRAFPQAIRGTVHPKPGQYAPILKNVRTIISPWHGVAILTASGEIVTEYESMIFQEFERFRAVYIYGDEAPFYYEELTE